LFKVQWTMCGYSWTTAPKCEYCPECNHFWRLHQQGAPALHQASAFSRLDFVWDTYTDTNLKHAATETAGKGQKGSGEYQAPRQMERLSSWQCK
jgi:hypothetical protein